MRRDTEDGGKGPGLYRKRTSLQPCHPLLLVAGSSVHRNLEAGPSQPGHPVSLEAEGMQAVGCDAPGTPLCKIWDCGASDVARAFLVSPDGGDAVMLLETPEHILPRVGQHV